MSLILGVPNPWSPAHYWAMVHLEPGCGSDLCTHMKLHLYKWWAHVSTCLLKWSSVALSAPVTHTEPSSLPPAPPVGKARKVGECCPESSLSSGILLGNVTELSMWDVPGVSKMSSPFTAKLYLPASLTVGYFDQWCWKRKVNIATAIMLLKPPSWLFWH